MFGIVADGEETAMDLGMQGLDPPVHHLRKAGEVRYVAHVEARVAQRPGGAAGGNEVHPLRGEHVAKRDEPRLVRNRKKGAPDLDLIHIVLVISGLQPRRFLIFSAYLSGPPRKVAVPATSASAPASMMRRQFP